MRASGSEISPKLKAHSFEVTPLPLTKYKYTENGSEFVFILKYLYAYEVHFYIIPRPWQEKAAAREPCEGDWEIWIRKVLELTVFWTHRKIS